ncbi:AsmA-like C-terminal region-containing protein [Roseicyclus elongatus]|uniref:AsmA-like C-terminal region-containing protein n=1 Tax=Roseicyclus elongatus TaxID=159346 RepID=UPI00046CEB8B|nr:AsmA-like C-terminal region-containing protein [Roseibacterium elongatum]
MRSAPAISGGTGGAGASGTAAGPVSVALDRLQVAEGIALTNLRADLNSVGGLHGQFRGLINGEAQVSGVLVAGDDGPSVRLQSDDGGAALRAAGIYANAYGGEMDLILEATGQPGSYDGRLSVDGPRLRNAPAVAELLNLISVVGLLEQLSGDGINLGDVDARFRLTPERIRLREGTAVGPSLGLSMDGVYDIASRQFEMQGVISPIYVVNGLIGAIFAPRREGLFGFSYMLRGTRADTNVTVNPLSILTPGVFREIFRAPPPDFLDRGQD